jgi:ribokinase
MIVVFGSLNADFVFPVPALPREGETVACEAVVLMPGGKGANQAAAARAEVRLAGCVGGDSFGDLLIGSLEEAGVGLDALERVSVSTGCAAVIVDAEGRN